MNKYKGSNYDKAILIIDNEIYEDDAHCGCLYKYAKKHLNEIKQFYTGVEDDKDGDKFWLDYGFGDVWDKLNINPILISIFGNELVIINYENLNQQCIKIIEDYAIKNAFDINFVDEDGYIKPLHLLKIKI